MSHTKVQRHRKIKSLLKRRKSDIQSKDDLVSELQAAGFEVDEKTVEKDIKELGIVEVSSGDGTKLALPPTAKVKKRTNRSSESTPGCRFDSWENR